MANVSLITGSSRRLVEIKTHFTNIPEGRGTVYRIVIEDKRVGYAFDVMKSYGYDMSTPEVKLCEKIKDSLTYGQAKKWFKEHVTNFQSCDVYETLDSITIIE